MQPEVAAVGEVHGPATTTHPRSRGPRIGVADRGVVSGEQQHSQLRAWCMAAPEPTGNESGE